MSSKPVFVVLTNDHSTATRNRRILTSGIYATLKEISGFIAPNGPPLPIIIQCTRDQAADLLPLAEKLRNVGNGMVVDDAERFVRAVIDEVRDMAIWPETPLFYGLVSSPSVRKVIAPNYDSVVNYISGAQGFLLHTFPTFIQAFIYVLAGGNSKLNMWGLTEWVGVGRNARNAPAPEFPLDITKIRQAPESSGYSPQQGSSSGQKPTESQGSRNNKGSESSKGSQEDSDDEIVVVPGTFATAGRRAEKGKSPLSPLKGAKASGVGGSRKGPAPSMRQSEVAQTSQGPTEVTSTLPPFPLPSHLVPQTFLWGKAVQAKPLPFISHRPDGDQRFTLFTLTDSSSVPNINGPLRSHPELPNFVYLYLLSHGWGGSVIESVSQALADGATRYEFLNQMSRSNNMPLAEAGFLWFMTQYFRG